MIKIPFVSDAIIAGKGEKKSFQRFVQDVNLHIGISRKEKVLKN